jgi:dethiobiotin synthetase
MRGYFITSSGTGIGKTYVTAGLAAFLTANGRKVRAIKPLISGYDEETAATSDTAEILKALGCPPDAAEIDKVSPWRYRAPLSPDMAADLEDRQPDYAGLLQFCRECAQGPEEILLIEGVGGAFVPLDDSHTVADWIAALGLPALLVVGSYLGTISHTLSAAKAMRRHGLEIAAVVVCASEGSPVALDATADSIRRFLPDVPVIEIPRDASLEPLAQALKL